MVPSILFWTPSPHKTLWQCLFLGYNWTFSGWFLRSALPDALYLYLDASTSHQRHPILEGQGFPNAGQKRLKASCRKAGALFGKASAEGPVTSTRQPLSTSWPREWSLLPEENELTFFVFILMVYLHVFIGNFWPYTWSKKTLFSNLALYSLATGLERSTYLNLIFPIYKPTQLLKISNNFMYVKPLLNYEVIYGCWGLFILVLATNIYIWEYVCDYIYYENRCRTVSQNLIQQLHF